MFRRYTVNENLSLQSLGAFLQPQFRSAVAHLPDKPEDDDYFYLRWLRAQKFDTAKAEVMLKKVGLRVCTPEWQCLDSICMPTEFAMESTSDICTQR